MATFRVGQRVRLVNVRYARNPDFHPCEGDEVTILGLPGVVPDYPESYAITRPEHHPRTKDTYSAPPYRLAPLTDPRADEFIERIKKLGREPVGLPQKETVGVRK